MVTNWLVKVQPLPLPAPLKYPLCLLPRIHSCIPTKSIEPDIGFKLKLYISSIFLVYNFTLLILYLKRRMLYS